jgi:hypothetical protein
VGDDGRRENARQQAREAALAVPYTGGGITQGKRNAADAASDEWEPIARTLRDHISGDPYCQGCWNETKALVYWPCDPWKRAAEAIGE